MATISTNQGGGTTQPAGSSPGTATTVPPGATPTNTPPPAPPSAEPSTFATTLKSYVVPVAAGGLAAAVIGVPLAAGAVIAGGATLISRAWTKWRAGK